MQGTKSYKDKEKRIRKYEPYAEVKYFKPVYVG